VFTGAISVTGDEITFSEGSDCGDLGVYRWAVEGETLTLTPVGPGEACAGRAIVLRDGVFTYFMDAG
jgi:hypothetical protein